VGNEADVGWTYKGNGPKCYDARCRVQGKELETVGSRACGCTWPHRSLGRVVGGVREVWEVGASVMGGDSAVWGRSLGAFAEIFRLCNERTSGRSSTL